MPTALGSYTFNFEATSESTDAERDNNLINESYEVTDIYFMHMEIVTSRLMVVGHGVGTL